MSTFSGKSYDASSYLKHRPSYPASLYSYLRTYLQLLPNEKVELAVDLACGPGEASVDLAKTVANRVVGVDPSEVMLAQARENIKPVKDQVDLVVGSDQTVTAQFPEHTVDLLCVAEAAHWFVYPDFWHTAHYLLKPGGTLAMWAYYKFSFENYPESGDIIKKFCLDKDKCGPYWNEGQSRLNTLYSELDVPSTLFEHEQRIVSSADSPNPATPFPMRRENVTVGEIMQLLKTYSAYHSWKEQNSTQPDILEETIHELLEKTGLKLDSKVTVNWETVVICAKAKALNEY